MENACGATGSFLNMKILENRKVTPFSLTIICPSAKVSGLLCLGRIALVCLLFFSHPGALVHSNWMVPVMFGLATIREAQSLKERTFKNVINEISLLAAINRLWLQLGTSHWQATGHTITTATSSITTSLTKVGLLPTLTTKSRISLRPMIPGMRTPMDSELDKRSFSRLLRGIHIWDIVFWIKVGS